MPDTPAGEYPKSAAFVAVFNYMAADRETDLNFRAIMETAYKVAVNEVVTMFGDRIEIIDRPDEEPIATTEVMDRDEV